MAPDFRGATSRAFSNPSRPSRRPMFSLLSTAAVLVLVPGFRVPPSSCSPQSARRCSPPRACQFDVNAALTDLNAAVLAEDYAEAARLKKAIAENAPEAAAATTWPEAMPVWLLERLEQLGLRFPTPIQSAALRAPADAVLRAPTGSGKTVAFLCVLLARCDVELQVRACSLPVRPARRSADPGPYPRPYPALNPTLPRRSDGRRPHCAPSQPRRSARRKPWRSSRPRSAPSMVEGRRRAPPRTRFSGCGSAARHRRSCSCRMATRCWPSRRTHADAHADARICTHMHMHMHMHIYAHAHAHAYGGHCARTLPLCTHSPPGLSGIPSPRR